MFTFSCLLTAFVAATAAAPLATPLQPGVYFSSAEVLRNAPPAQAA